MLRFDYYLKKLISFGKHIFKSIQIYTKIYIY